MEVNLHPKFALLSSYSREFQAQLRRIAAFTKHPGSIGTSHEGILRRFLHRYVPQRLAVSEGFIVDRQGNASPQCDIIIWSHLDFSPYYRDGDFVIVPTDSVSAVIEIKTGLTKKPLIAAFENLDQIHKLRDDIFTCIFAFESSQLETILRNIAYDLEPDLAAAVDVIHAMGGWTLARLGRVEPDDPNVPSDIFMAASPHGLRREGMEDLVPFALAFPPARDPGLDLAVFLGFLFSNLASSPSKWNLFSSFALYPDIKLLFLDYLFPGIGQAGDEEEIERRIAETVIEVEKILEDDYEKIIASYEETIANYQEIDKNTRSYAEAYYKRGVTHANKGDSKRAFADFQKAIQLASDYADAYNGRGTVYFGQSDYDLAFADFNKAIELQPEHAAAHCNRGDIYALRQEYTLAIADFDQALKCDPSLARAYYKRGHVSSLVGNYDQAIIDYEKALEITPDEASLYNDLATVYLYKGDYDQALANYEKAIQKDPDHACAYNGRGTILCKRGEFDRAIADFDRAIQLNPDYDQAYYNRGMTYELRGNIDQAIADYDEVLRLSKQPDLRKLVQQRLSVLRAN